MSRRPLIWTAAALLWTTVALLCAALAPAAALAGTFSWSQPGDFTATGSGANPEHDYGAPSWSYSSSTGPLRFSPSFDSGALAGWSDDPAAPSTWIAVATGATPSSVQLVPAEHGSVTLTWTSPYAQSEPVSFSGSISEPNASVGLLGTSTCDAAWTLDSSGSSQPLASGSGAGPDALGPGTVTVPAGGTVTLTVTDNSSGVLGDPYTTACVTTDATLALSAPGIAPTVAITGPGQGAQFAGGAQPSFTGSATSGFGASPVVTLRIYAGSSASGTPVQTIATSASSGSWSLSPSSPLAAGTYTAQAQQDDLASPPDAGLSAPVTFTIQSVAPPSLAVKLNSLGSRPLTEDEPALSGSASTAAGASPTVQIDIYAQGSSQPVQQLSAPVGSGGDFQATASPALADGFYAAVASQSSSAGGLVHSDPIYFEIKVHPPALTLFYPFAGARVTLSPPVLFGYAGHDYGDYPQVTVTLYAGAGTGGRAYGRASVRQQGGIWLLRWPRRLPLGLYTVTASQRDNAGHVTTTAPRTFMLVPSPGMIGPTVSVAQNGLTSVAIDCRAPVGSRCAGALTIVSLVRLRLGRGRARRRVLVRRRLLLPGGQVTVVRAHLDFALRAALARRRVRRVIVSVTLRPGDGRARTYRARRLLLLAR